MTNHPISKRDQYALIAFIAKHCGGANRRLGKKALQKHVHLIQELGAVDSGYRFSFYTYGPYSSELSGDLDVVAATGGVKVSYNSMDNFYLIDAGAEADYLLEKGAGFIERNHSSMRRVLDSFGGRMAKDLELVSTIAYLRKHARHEYDDDGRLLARVKALKPKYSDEEIIRAVREVRTFLAQRIAA